MPDRTATFRRRQVVCVGSLNMDLLLGIDRLPDEHEKMRSQSFSMQCGGSAANTAFWLASLNCDVAMIGCVGDDAFGSQCIADLERVGVFCGGVIRRHGQQTGTAIILHNGSSKRIITTGGANRLLVATDISSETLTCASHVHLATSNNVVALHALALAKQGGATTSSDLNGPASLERLRLLDLCIMNFDDLCRWLGGDSPFAAWDGQFAGENSNSPPALVVTDSSRGAMTYCNGILSRIPTEPVMPLDRTGGGDAFSAGLIWCYAQNHQLAACVRFGLALAKRVILAVGSRPQVDLTSDEFLREVPT